jgi:hypothetical protein
VSVVSCSRMTMTMVASTQFDGNILAARDHGAGNVEQYSLILLLEALTQNCDEQLEKGSAAVRVGNRRALCYKVACQCNCFFAERETSLRVKVVGGQSIRYLFFLFIFYPAIPFRSAVLESYRTRVHDSIITSRAIQSFATGTNNTDHPVFVWTCGLESLPGYQLAWSNSNTSNRVEIAVGVVVCAKKYSLRVSRKSCHSWHSTQRDQDDARQFSI